MRLPAFAIVFIIHSANKLIARIHYFHPQEASVRVVWSFIGLLHWRAA
jgi:hypothetical protein